jgi:hypothetical protein
MERLHHSDDRRRIRRIITRAARVVLDEFMPSIETRERDVISIEASSVEQHELLHLLASVQNASLQTQPTRAKHATTCQRLSPPGAAARAMKGTWE